ncbi:MAG: hypothetical protein D8M59_09000 [Planctomycetes bacterium]|nr:hypothetical protein [Planctomycetota bacterium]NOG54197.1 hypothetical protein [Planctomycetota bacterium]
MFEFLKNLDRRWVFLLMMLSVAIPIIVIDWLGLSLPEKPSELARNVFDEIDQLNEGDKVLLSFDFDPASEGELGPMATSFVHHCAEKKLKMYFMALWPVGPQMIDDSIDRVIDQYYDDLVYGEDFVNLGFKSGGEGVIKVIVTNLRELYTTDDKGTAIDDIPMMEGVRNIRQMDLIVNVSAGSAGTKEWVQYAATPFPDDIRIVGGCTGVQAPLLYPYIPEQLPGLLGAIKGAAEYEKLVNDAYEPDPDNPRPVFTEGLRRMGPQLVAHLLIILLIVVANIIYFVERAKGGER